jgi:UDPglucose 6-dehydrogenase
MRVTIFGSGYVGLVTGACLADAGNDVLCVDVDAGKVQRLNSGEIPIHEPGLESLIRRNCAAGRLTFTTDGASGVERGELLMIAVGTPPDEDGSADLRHVLAVARTIGEKISGYRVVIVKSTVPVGTSDKVASEIRARLAARNVECEFDVVSNPEFLKEGAAIADFMKPDRVVIGTSSPRAIELLQALYQPFTRSYERLIVMDVRSSELTKYAANAMLATKISFINELAGIAEKVGADIEKVRRGIGSDSRIGYNFIYPGAGYGGSCFPKDVKALIRTAGHHGAPTRVLQAVESTNAAQKHVVFERLSTYFGASRIAGLTVAVWGLAFKPNTDDMREAPSRVLMEQLWAAGARVRAYDPEAMDEARRIYGERSDLVLCRGTRETLQGADALVVMTEWQEFRSPDFDLIRTMLRQPVVFDGRNVYDPQLMKRRGIVYYGIGRGESVENPA